MTTNKYIIKSDNKFVTNNDKLTKNINFAYVYDNIEEAEQIAKYMQLEEYEIVKY